MAKKLSCAGMAVPMVRLAFEKGKCLRTTGPILNSPAAIASNINVHYGCRPQEVFLSLAFNSRNELINVHEVSTGAYDSTAVDPRVVFGGALLSGASALVFIHNHPSGSEEPSPADISLTRQLVQAATHLGLKVLDHIVIARGGKYTSFLERGLMPTQHNAQLGDEQLHYGGLIEPIPVVPAKSPRSNTLGGVRRRK